jgi:hypothetical protein
MRIAISIREGRVSSALLLRRLSTESRRNNVYKAFRALGRAICTITLLRLISEPELRAQIDAATNKVESYNNFSGWLAFGSEGIERNDPAEQEKMIKFNTLPSNCVIFHIALDMSTAVRGLIAQGHEVDLDDLASMAPYITERVKRFLTIQKRKRRARSRRFCHCSNLTARSVASGTAAPPGECESLPAVCQCVARFCPEPARGVCAETAFDRGMLKLSQR